MDTLLLSIEETARQLGGVSTRTVWRMIESGELCPVKVRRSVKIPSAIVKEWVENQLQPAHNFQRAGEAVQTEGGKSTCQSAKHETKTAFSKGRIPHTGGQVSPAEAANRLAEVLAFGATKTPKKNAPRQ